MKRQTIGLVIALLATGCQQPTDNRVVPTPATEHKGTQRLAVLDTIASEPQFVWLATLRDLYPNDYRAVRDVYRQSTTGDPDLDDLKMTLADAIKPIMARRRDAAKLAPDAELVAYLRRSTAVTAALAVQDPVACDAVAKGQLNPATELPDTTWTLMSEATAQLLRTAHAAEAAPVYRDAPKISAEEYQRWRTAMEAVGADGRTFRLITDPLLRATATPIDTCRARLQMMQAALNLPPPLAAKITINILAMRSE